MLVVDSDGSAETVSQSAKPMLLVMQHREREKGIRVPRFFRFWNDQLGWSVTTFAAGPLCCDCLLLISQVSVMPKGTV